MADGPSESEIDVLEDPLAEAVLQIDIGKHPTFAEFDSLGQGSAKRAINSLQAAIREGYLNVGKVKRILDFGAGRGGPTFVLTRVAKVIGADVEAIEKSDVDARYIVTSGILPANKVHIGNGVKFLKKQPGEEYDLITGFMFGPDDAHASLFQKMARASSRALSPHGRLLINSEMRTVAEIERVAKVNHIEYSRIQGVGRDLTTLIFPQAEVAKLAY